jgi:hypothetical protein
MTGIDVDRLARALHETRTFCFGRYRSGYPGAYTHDCLCGDHWDGECLNQPHKARAILIADAYAANPSSEKEAPG